MHKTQKNTWYQDVSFWKTFESTMFNQERLGVTAEEIDHIVKLLAPEKVQKFWICAVESADTRWNLHGEAIRLSVLI